MNKKAIVFAPHPDDEILGCGGTIAKRLSEGYDVFVVFVTDGRYGLAEIGITSDPSPLEIKETRRDEAIKAVKILGLQEKNIFFLDIEDKNLEKHERDVRERIVEILKDIAPVEIYFPQEKEYNIDHRVTNNIVKKAVNRSKLNPIKYQYAIAWAFPLYLLAHVLNERSFDLLTSDLLKCDLIHVGISKFLPLKKMALEEYKSQLTLLSSEQKRPALKPSSLKRFLRNEEKFFVKASSR